MTFVVTESCIRCKHTDCVDVCPTDAFREGPTFMVIDPDDCIDCTLCVSEGPVDAIVASMAASALSLFHKFDATIMILMWNLGSAALLVGLGALLGRKMFIWSAPHPVPRGS